MTRRGSPCERSAGNRSPAKLVAGGAGAIAVLLACAAFADPPAGLAPPGPCAEPRIEAREVLPGFDVAGSPRSHFDPNDVGAAGRGEAPGDTFDPPKPPPPFTRGPCEGPAGCDSVVGGIIESPPVPGNPPPGTTPR